MNGIDTPKDPSDHPLSVDQKLIATMHDVDTLTEGYIRQEIGDKNYDDYIARTEVNRDFDAVTAGISPPPVELVSARAQEIAREMVVPGEGVSGEIDSLAHTAAFAEWVDSLGDTNDDEYLEVYGEVRRVIADAVNKDLSLEYPDMELQNAQGGIVNFEQKGDEGLTLRIIFKMNESKLDTEVSYVKMPLKPGEPMVQVPVDVGTSNGEVEGIMLSRFKSDALMALQTGVDQLKQLKELSE